MEATDLALVQGLADTRVTLRLWAQRPGIVLRTWVPAAVAISCALLGAVVVVAALSTPDPTPVRLARPSAAGMLEFLYSNSLVLALHAMACVAGFIAGSSLPLTASRHTGVWRSVHDRAGPLAIAFVIGATTFSLCTQAYVLGGFAATQAAQRGIAPALLVLALLPHALIELTALFLPLAAWIIASRRGDWHQLLAATVVTVALALPLLLVAAVIEVWLSPYLLDAVSAHAPRTLGY
ncbi:MAG TPA: hypothetical protein VHE14_05830 [Solirubrobacteraceae bacterium]|nr:hypothetical protein [Solirubrobacteraceae bacterium]